MVNVLYILYIIRGRGFYMCISIVLSGFFKMNLNKFNAGIFSHPQI